MKTHWSAIACTLGMAIREGDHLVASCVIVARPAMAVSPPTVIRQTTTTTTESDDDDYN